MIIIGFGKNSQIGKSDWGMVGQVTYQPSLFELWRSRGKEGAYRLHGALSESAVQPIIIPHDKTS